MADRANESGKLLMEAFMYRFHPRSRRIKGIVDKGGIGNPRLIRSTFCFHMDDETGEVHTIKSADEYQLMVEHFADAVQQKTYLNYSTNDSIANMHELDAIAVAARTGNTVKLSPES